MSKPSDTENDRGPLRLTIGTPTGDRWLRFCHNKGFEPNPRAEVALRADMERDTTEDRRDWREAARRLAAAYRKETEHQ